MPASTIQRELALLVTGKDVSATRTLKGVNRQISSLERHASKAGRNMGRNIERGITIGAFAAAGAIGYAINAAMDWESAVAGVAKTIEGDVTAITDAILEMSTRIPVAATELAAIAEAGGALGIAKEDILAFTETVAILSVTTDLTSETAATALGHLRTTLQLTGDDFRELADGVVYLGNNGASTESQILGMAESIAGAAGIVKASKEDVLAWASAVASTGEEVEAGGSSIQRFWLESFRSVQKGGTELKLMAKITGQSAAQFEKAFGKDATGTLATFITKLGELSEAEQLATLEALGFTDIRITRSLLKLLSNTENLTQSYEDVEKSAGAAGEEARIRFETTASQVQLLKNNVHQAAIVIGSELLPIVNELAKEGIDWLQEHPEEIAAFAKDLAAGIRDAVTWARSLDWDMIASSLKAGASFAGLLIDAFASAPPWVQSFLIGGFVANKFTGGVVGDIIGELGKGLIRGILGMNAGVVNINAAVVNGAGGLPGAAAGAGKGAAALGIAAMAASAAVIAGSLIAANELVVQPMLQSQAGSNITNTEALIKRGDAAELTAAIAGLRAMPDQLSPLERALYDLNANGVKTHTESLISAMEGALARVKNTGVSQENDPDKRQWRNDNPDRPAELARARETKAELIRLRDQASRNKDDQVAATQSSTTKISNVQSETKRETARGLAVTASATRATESAARTAGAQAAAATNASAARLIAAIWASGRANRSIVSNTTINQTTNRQSRSGDSNASRHE
jgi:TP901 family phage tail tape measure protein